MDPGQDLDVAVRFPAASCLSSTGCASLCDQCKVKALAVCSALNEHDLRELEALAGHQALGARQHLFQKDEPARYVYSVTAGTIRLQHDIEDGRRQVIGFALPGDFIGLSLQQSHGFSADSLTPVTVCRFDRRRFSDLADRHPSMMRRLHEVAAHKLAFAQEHMVVLGRRRAEERVAIFLWRWRQRLTVVQGPSATIHLPMGRQDIADYLGLTIETVSRTLSRFMREKVILDVPNGVRLLDRDRLEALAGGSH